MKDRFKNYSFWTALAGAVVIFLNALGDCFGFAINNELVSGLIMSIAGLLVVFGIVTMPTNNKDENSQNSQVENQDDEILNNENQDEILNNENKTEENVGNFDENNKTSEK